MCGVLHRLALILRLLVLIWVLAQRRLQRRLWLGGICCLWLLGGGC